MKIIVGKYSGFCNGVKYTVDKANEIIKNDNEVYCIGEIVHNERVIKNLEKSNLKTINSINELPNNSKLIIRAHGEKKETYEICKNKNIKIIDLTCGKIQFIKKKIEKGKKNNNYIIIIGKKNHPETAGILSFAGKNACIVETEDDLIKSIDIINKSNLNQIYVVSQTTFSSKKFDYLVSILKNNCKKEIIIDKTICDVTEKRQEECLSLSKIVTKMIIVGGKNSSNTKELYKIAANNLDDVILIQDVNDITNQIYLKEDIVGIMAGASTPQIVIDEVISYLNSFVKE